MKVLTRWPKKAFPLDLSSLIVMAFFTSFLVMCNNDDNDVEVLECIGSCTCDEDTRTCTCQGGTQCTIEGEEDITLICDGNASCDLSCGIRCHVICPGTTGCTVEMGDDSSAECQGNAECDYTCLGDCEVRCSGTPQCIVRCAEGATCTIVDCDSHLTDCGDGIQACRTDCPTPD